MFRLGTCTRVRPTEASAERSMPSVWCRFMQLRLVNIVDFSRLQYQRDGWSYVGSATGETGRNVLMLLVCEQCTWLTRRLKMPQRLSSCAYLLKRQQKSSSISLLLSLFSHLTSRFFIQLLACTSRTLSLTQLFTQLELK